jgi:hypothetical protein
LLFCVLSSVIYSNGRAQEKTLVLDSARATNVVVAGVYKNTPGHTFFFGKHYRKEWLTPVRVPVMILDTTFRGLEPYQGGGGRQSKSLRLQDDKGHEYVLRSLDKSFGRALPDVFRGTFVEDLIDDQVTIGHPYSAFTIAPMAESVKIYHTNPVMGYVPKQPMLDSFNEDYGDRLYMLEQRPDENWSTAENFGNSKKIIGTDKMIEKVLKDNDNRIDQKMYVRARLFDFIIGDWGRHEDQWRWATIEDGDKTIYRPIPRDRDQAYTKFDGVLTKTVLAAANLDHLQTYRPYIKELKVYGFTGRHLDRFCANELALEDWQSIGRDIQARLTDEVIEKSVRLMPPEVFPLSGEEIIGKLKLRRDKILEYATGYYTFLARHVDVAGSKGTDFFKVQRLDDEQTLVEAYNITKEGETEPKPFYTRVFKTSETKDVRLYGLSGKDKYVVDGNAGKGINVRIIGGTDKDSIIDNSEVGRGARKTNVYDSRDNYFAKSSETHLHLSNDSAINAYNYEEYEYHKRGIKPLVSYDNPDRIYASIGYGFARHRWRKYPYGFQQAVYLRYSLSQNAFSTLYEGNFYQAVGKWNVNVTANYDAIRWTNYYGLGNDTKEITDNRDYYRLKTNEILGSVGLFRNIGLSTITFTASYRAIEILGGAGQFVTDNYSSTQLFNYEHNQFAGANLEYEYQNVDDPGVPIKGIMFYSGFGHTLNVETFKTGFTKYAGIFQGYLPLKGKFSLAVRTGFTTVSGQPEFYQYASIGGSQTFRGLRRDRFWGNTAFYNNNDLRYITNFRSYIMNGKIGALTFVDNGRVWYDPEESDTWHLSYGGGVLLAPFNKFMVSLVYAISDQDRMLHIRLNRML